MTEKSSIPISSRENVTWWKTFMWVVCENHSGAAMQKVDVSVAVYLR